MIQRYMIMKLVDELETFKAEKRRKTVTMQEVIEIMKYCKAPKQGQALRILNKRREPNE